MAWSAAVPEILLAWECKVEFVRNTNPFGAPSATPGSEKSLKEETPEEKRQRIKAKIRGARA